MENSNKIIIRLAFLTIIVCIASYFIGSYQVKEIAYVEGRLNGKVDFKNKIPLILDECAQIFQNYHTFSDNVVEYVIQSTDKNLNKSMELVVDTININILKSILLYGDISSDKTKQVLDNYEKEKQKIIKNYYQHPSVSTPTIKKHKTPIEDKTHRLVQPLNNSICELLKVIPTDIKMEIIYKMIGSPTIDYDSVVLAQDELLMHSHIANNFCNLIKENSIEFLIQDLMDYARIYSFSNSIVKNSSQRSAISHLIGLEKSFTFNLPYSITRRTLIFFNNEIPQEAEFKGYANIGVDLDKKFNIKILKKELYGLNKNRVIIQLSSTEALKVNVQLLNIRKQEKKYRLSGQEIGQLYDLASAYIKDECRKSNSEARASIINNLTNLYTPILKASRADFDLVVEFL